MSRISDSINDIFHRLEPNRREIHKDAISQGDDKILKWPRNYSSKEYKTERRYIKCSTSFKTKGQSKEKCVVSGQLKKNCVLIWSTE